jgi:hypothetical protein
MAASFIGGEVALTGTTPVTVVAAPGAGAQRQVLSLLAINRDSTSRTITAKKVGGTVTETIGTVVLAAGLRGQMVEGSVVLDGTGETITVESDATAAATEPVVDVAVFQVAP